jgi:hypothetical protein
MRSHAVPFTWEARSQTTADRNVLSVRTPLFLLVTRITQRKRAQPCMEVIEAVEGTKHLPFFAAWVTAGQQSARQGAIPMAA